MRRCWRMRRRLGYAEADPSADVDGFDARAKLCILSRIALHAELDPDAVATQTISTVEAMDFAYAKELGCTIRQVSRAQLDGEVVHARVAPMLVPMTSPIAWSHGTQNMVVTSGRFGGDVVFSGHGAGGEPTAVAVMSDVLAVAQGSRGAAAGAEAAGDGRVCGAALSAVCGGRQAGDCGGDCGRAGEGGSEHRFDAAASGVSEASAAVCGDDGAVPDFDDREGGGGDCEDGLHAGAAAVSADSGVDDKAE